MKYLTLMILLVLFAHVAYAGGNMGVTFNQVIDDRSGGVVGEYEYNGDPFDFQVDGQLQFGDIYRGKARAELIFDISAVGIKLLTDITSKGYTLDTLGRSQNVGIALTVPVKSLNFDIGIGGKNSNPWDAPNALDELVPKGYNESELEALGLAEIHPAPKGIPFRSGNFLNAFVETGFEKGNVEVDLKGISEVAGEGERAHELHTRFQSSRQLFDRVNLNVGLEVGFQLYEEVIHYETALLTTVGCNF